jgi:hypothetical protein
MRRPGGRSLVMTARKEKEKKKSEREKKRRNKPRTLGHSTARYVPVDITNK